MYLGGAIAALLAIIWLRTKTTRAAAHLPPGPKPLPILGNIRDFALSEFWLPATRWAKEFGWYL